MKVVALSLLVALVFAAPWSSNNDPSSWPGLNLKFSDLPTNGKVPVQPWSDTYWPSMESGIAHRWNSDNPQDFNYQLNTKAQLQQMSQDDIKALSPAEKYDIFVGRYDYPLVHSEWQRTHPNDAGWEGLCHGWAPAAIAYTQPNPVTLQNADGITIPFGSSDVKALLTYYCAQYDREPAQQFIAGRCNIDIQANPRSANTPDCADINAGTYHAIVANLIGNQSTSFVIDRDRSIQVWNQPMYSYETTIVNQDSNSAQLQVVNTYIQETQPQWEAHDAATNQDNYKYTVEFDNNGILTGGSQQSWERPDFAWTLQPSAFHGYFAQLQTVYQNSTMDFKKRPEVKSVSEVASSIYTTSEGSFSLQGPYPDNYKQRWIIAPSNAREIKITFLSMDIEKVFDSVTVYEGADGLGAPVAVLYGNKVPIAPIVVKSSGAMVFFKSNNGVSGAGFKVVYSIN